MPQLLRFPRIHRIPIMTDFSALDKIKDRIAKLLRMAADSSSPNEAAIAAGRARALMDQHQLDAHDVADRTEDVFASQAASGKYKTIPRYMSILAVAVAQYNDCQAKYEMHYVSNADQTSTVEKKCVQFLGYKSDVDLGIQMFDRLLKIIDKLAKTHVQEVMPLEKPGSDEMIRVSALFKMGASEELVSRLQQMTITRDAIVYTGTSTSLVLTKTKAVDAHFGKATYSRDRARRMSGAEQDARNAGRAAASTVVITQAVK